MRGRQIDVQQRPQAMLWICLLTAIAGLLLSSHAAGIRLNLSGSIPMGLYQVVGDAAHLTRGEMVLACLPSEVAALAHSRGYVPRGGGCSGSMAPVGKLVMALPGDTVTVTAVGLRVNNVPVANSTQLKRDGAGRSLPLQATGPHIVAPGTLWLIGSSGRSFDSRYFGAVQMTSVLARIERIW